MKENDTVEYIGKGFLGFDKEERTMIVKEILSFDVWCLYKGKPILVRNSEIKVKQ